MPEGVVKRWNILKGFGFITPTNPPSSADVFVHQSALQMDGFRCLSEGETVRFELTQEEDGRSRASSVTAPDGSKLKGLWADEAHLTGTVARWRTDKGFGFITPADGSGDVFVHQSAIHAVGYRSLSVGDTVEYAVGAEEGSAKPKATKVTAPGGRPVRAQRDAAAGVVGGVGVRYPGVGLSGGGLFVGGDLSGLGLGSMAAFPGRGGAGAPGFVGGGGYSLGYGGYALGAMPAQHLAAAVAAGGYESARGGAGLAGYAGLGLGLGYPGEPQLGYHPAVHAAQLGHGGGGPPAPGGLRSGPAFGF